MLSRTNLFLLSVLLLLSVASGLREAQSADETSNDGSEKVESHNPDEQDRFIGVMPDGTEIELSLDQVLPVAQGGNEIGVSDLVETPNDMGQYEDLKPENGVDGGVTPTYSPERVQTNELTDNDIKNDIDLGRKPIRRRGIKKPSELISEKDIKNDVDLGLHHSRHLGGNAQDAPISDKDVENDQDLGLHHEKEEPSDDSEDIPITDDMIKDDVDLGLSRNDYHELKRVENPKQYYITENDMEDDVDLGLKPNDNSVTVSPDATIPDEYEKLAEHYDKKLEQRRKDKVINHERNAAESPITEKDIRDDQDLGRLKPKTHPEIVKEENSHQESMNLKAHRLALLKDRIASLKEDKSSSKSQNRRQNPAEVNEPELISPTKQNDNICHRYDVDGCSIPFGLPFFFKELFTNSCYRHDICYGCGHKYGFSRDACDNAFKANMWEACFAKYGGGGSNAADPRKRRIASVVESLREHFDDILKEEMSPMMDPPIQTEKDMERFERYAHRIQRKVLKQWVELLRSQLVAKTKKLFSKVSNLVYDKKQLRVEKFEELSLDNNLTVDLCDEVLNHSSDVEVSRRTELSCEEIELLSCHFFNYVYFLSVRVFASSFYHYKPEFYCGQDFVHKCLPRN